MLAKLEKYSFRGSIHCLLRNYLSKWSQVIRIQNHLSRTPSINCGVPQNSLGPILFIIYMNDIFNIETQSQIICYADDTAILFTGQTWDNVVQIARREFPVLRDWFWANYLTLNMKKTQTLAFSCYQDSLPQLKWSGNSRERLWWP